MLEFLNHKKVLFITTKNLDYIRNSQELRLIHAQADSYDVIGSYEKSYIKRFLSVYRKLLWRKVGQYDLVFVGFAPQLVVPLFRKLKKRELAIDFFISMYDTLVCDRRKFKEKSLAARFFKWLDKKTLLKADYIVTDTKSHGAYFTEEFGADINKEYTLYLEADPLLYYPREQEKNSGIKDKFVVLYFGSILPLQGVSVILEAIGRLQMRKDIFFYMVGPLSREIGRPDNPNVEYISWLSQEALADKIAEADLCLAGHFHGSIAKARRTIPGKAYIYAAMKKPMVLGDNEANRELYEEKDGEVYYVEMGNPKLLAAVIAELADRWEEQRDGE